MCNGGEFHNAFLQRAAEHHSQTQDKVSVLHDSSVQVIVHGLQAVPFPRMALLADTEGVSFFQSS